MSIGTNRRNDTPIGGLPEFRGNFQSGDVFQDSNVPAYDLATGQFVPATNSGLKLGYGGLAANLIAGLVADGSIIANWAQVTPLFGIPLQTTPDAVAGTITITQAGTYTVDFTANLTALVNNQDYAFRINLNGVDTSVGGVVSGSNSIEAQSVAFSLPITAAAPNAIAAITASNAGNNGYSIVSASFTITRIG